MTLRAGFAALFGLYLLVIAWVWAGSILSSRGGTVSLAAIQAGTAFALGAIVWTLTPRSSPGRRSDPSRHGFTIAMVLAAILAALVLGHWIALRGLPVLSAIMAESDVDAGLVRTEIISKMTIPLVNYIPTLVIKAGVPFLVIYFLYRERPGPAFLLLAIGLVYAVSLLQKAYPLYVALPPSLYLLMRRQWKSAALCIAAACAAVFFLYAVANFSFYFRTTQDLAAVAATPQQQKNPTAGAPLHTGAVSRVVLPTADESKEIARDMASSLAWRVLADPGLTVNQWFRTFPAVYPFTRGCSYRFLAPLLGCDATGNSIMVWEHHYAGLKERGFHGSAGAAHFMEEYAAFGKSGLVAASILAIVVLLLSAYLSAGMGWPTLIAMNLPFVAALSSTGLHTTILSGGWLFVWVLMALLPMKDA